MGSKLVTYGDNALAEDMTLPVQFLPKTISEISEELFPYYLSIGMTPEQYWEGDVYLIAYYQKAHLLSTDRKSQEMWLQGLYIYNALSVVAQNILRKKGQKAESYMAEPIRLSPVTKEEKEAKVIQQRKQAIDYFNSWIKGKDKKQTEQ